MYLISLGCAIKVLKGVEKEAGVYWIKFQVPTIFAISGKKFLDKPKKCLSVVVCDASTAYISLCRGLKYLLKVRFIILIHPNVAWFYNFKTLCLGSPKTLPYVWKKNHKNERHLCLAAHIFTKLSQNVYLISIHMKIF